MTKDKDRQWDGKSRPSNNVYSQRWNEIFGKKEIDELAESCKESKRAKKERTDQPLDSFSKDLKNSIKKNYNGNS